jgi:hypothetical protein
MKTPKQAKSDRLYIKQSREWLANGGSWRTDQISAALRKGIIPATCVHHIRGRHKTLKFDKRFWCPTTMQNSIWPHQNIAEARKLGLIAEQGDWHREPGDEETERIKAWMIEKGIW